MLKYHKDCFGPVQLIDGKIYWQALSGCSTECGWSCLCLKWALPIGHASYLISSLHIGLALFPSVALFLRSHIVLTCQKSMGASTHYSMLAISILILAQFLLALHHLFPLVMMLLVNLKLRIFLIPVWVTLGLNILSSGLTILFLKLCGNLPHI